jgi:hypothetical protein
MATSGQRDGVTRRAERGDQLVEQFEHPIDGLAVEHAEVGQRGAADGGEQGPEDLQDAVHGAQGAHGVAGGGRGVRFGTGGEAEEAGVVEAISQRSTA